MNQGSSIKPLRLEPIMKVKNQNQNAEAHPVMKPRKKMKNKAPRELVKIEETFFADVWQDEGNRNGCVPKEGFDFGLGKMRKTVTYIIQSAKKRVADKKSVPMPVLNQEEFDMSLKTVPNRGVAKTVFFEIDMETWANSMVIPYDDLKSEANGRSMAMFNEFFAARHFGMVRFLKDAPGADGYFLRPDGIMELCSVKGLGKSDFKPQFSSLTAHGSKVTLDFVAFLESIRFTAWIVVGDITMLPQVQLTLVPASAVLDWAKDGLLVESGLGPDRFMALVAASCALQVCEPVQSDMGELAKNNKLAAEADAAAMEKGWEARRAKVLALAGEN